MYRNELREMVDRIGAILRRQLDSLVALIELDSLVALREATSGGTAWPTADDKIGRIEELEQDNDVLRETLVAAVAQADNSREAESNAGAVIEAQAAEIALLRKESKAFFGMSELPLQTINKRLLARDAEIALLRSELTEAGKRHERFRQEIDAALAMSSVEMPTRVIERVRKVLDKPTTAEKPKP